MTRNGIAQSCVKRNSAVCASLVFLWHSHSHQMCAKLNVKVFFASIQADILHKNYGFTPIVETNYLNKNDLLNGG